jgi:hypothetical protein
MAYVLRFSEPADLYSLDVHFLRTGNPVELNTSRKSSEAECAPCTGSNLTLREKIMSLDEMVLLEENEDDSPLTDDL